ncbi:MAG: DUF4336 domain-containing protein [Cyanobacteria bacterium]|nr:DUF4336 domain-containing protein [Cyanobacteriota bacterium]MDA0865224.1 DUF4336 domain-containing protein [Cyanobacteriota bacterium]
MALIEIAPDLWTATQPLRFLGLEVGSRMTVVRLPSQDLVLISPIALDEPIYQALDQLGTVRHIIAPNLFHHLSIAATQALYPQAKLWGVADLPAKRPDLTFDALLTEPGCFGEVLDYRPFEGFAAILPRGIKLARETVFCHRPSRTLILTDIAFNFDHTSSLLTRLAAQMLGSYQTLRPSRLEKWGSRDKVTVEASVRQILAWDFDRVIPGHGAILETGGKDQLQAGYEWFLEKAL